MKLMNVNCFFKWPDLLDIIENENFTIVTFNNSGGGLGPLFLLFVSTMK